MKNSSKRAPVKAPRAWASIYERAKKTFILFLSRRKMKANVTAGLKCDPLILQKNILRIQRPSNSIESHPATKKIIKKKDPMYSITSLLKLNLMI